MGSDIHSTLLFIGFGALKIDERSQSLIGVHDHYIIYFFLLGYWWFILIGQDTQSVAPITNSFTTNKVQIRQLSTTLLV